MNLIRKALTKVIGDQKSEESQKPDSTQSQDPGDKVSENNDSRVVPRVWVKELRFGNDKCLSVGPNDVVVIVGPNNAGKSALLRGIRDKLRKTEDKNPVLNSISLEKTGDHRHVREWLEQIAVTTRNSWMSERYNSLGAYIDVDFPESNWTGDNGFGLLGEFFCQLLSAEDRLGISNPPKNISLAVDPPTHPIHFLLRDDLLEATISQRFWSAFGVGLVVHRNAGATVPLHVGDAPALAHGEDRVSLSYVKRLEELPTLETQGDGMRSFAGVLLSIAVGHRCIILIDEPEAFLHPPHARQLGLALTKEKKDDRQLFVATHSSYVLRGVLDSVGQNVKIVRLTRHGDTNVVRKLDADELQELWSDSLLRYSNILDGLFHEGVVVCESDSDCRFYGAIFDALFSDGSKQRPDLMFTHVGGKDRLHVAVEALGAVGVPVCLIADFDILRNEQSLRTVLEKTEVSFESVAKDCKQMNAALSSKHSELRPVDFKQGVDKICEAATGPSLSNDSIVAIQALLKRASPWSFAKSAGTSALPSGGPSQSCERLLETLRKGGIFVVPCGESESFLRTAGGHGQRWVNEALKRDLARDPELREAREFVEQFAAFFQ